MVWWMGSFFWFAFFFVLGKKKSRCAWFYLLLVCFRFPSFFHFSHSSSLSFVRSFFPNQFSSYSSKLCYTAFLETPMFQWVCSHRLLSFRVFSDNHFTGFNLNGSVCVCVCKRKAACLLFMCVCVWVVYIHVIVSVLRVQSVGRSVGRPIYARPCLCACVYVHVVFVLLGSNSVGSSSRHWTSTSSSMANKPKEFTNRVATKEKR